MKLVEGLYNQAVVYTDVVEDTALAQIRILAPLTNSWSHSILICEIGRAHV